MTASPPVESHMQRAERRIVEVLRLTQRPLDTRLAQARGLWKDSPVTITTRVYDGDAITRLRVAQISGEHLSIGSLLVLPRANRPVPILAAELVSRPAQRETGVVVDMVPVRDALEREAELASIARAVPRAPTMPASPARRPWAGEWNSPSAFDARVTVDRAEDALRIFDVYVDGWLSLVTSAAPSAERAMLVRTRQAAYLLARRLDDTELTLLGTMFGHAWAEEYVGTVLFPGAG